ncbi:hypothetical protein [Robiginitomaculum antarcticum]|uniref:hypothetical protein n=1 Tax=Robiginitomaculum antarcticum TaxID=437507 RepID=UPI00037CCD9F|nr:hypothetical protein [Robiginitomaculum antarcticum]
MLLKSFSLLRAGRDREKARGLAGEIAVDAALLPARFLLARAVFMAWAAFALIVLFGALGLWLGSQLHGIFYIFLILAVLAGTALYFALRAIRRLRQKSEVIAGHMAVATKDRIETKLAARRRKAEAASNTQDFV